LSLVPSRSIRAPRLSSPVFSGPASRGEAAGRYGDDAAAGLYSLALIDVRTLTRAPHNIATLYLLPEVQGEEFASFRAEHAELQATCGRLGRAAAAKRGSLDEELTATLIMRLVESVVQLRRFGELRDGYAREIALSCLRRIGLDPPAVAKARAAAEQLSPA
jgi:hypothetical protein